MAGIKRQLGDAVAQKIPLMTSQIYNNLDLNDESVATMWCALMLCFRTLLRKSNMVPDNLDSARHIVRRKDLIFIKGCIVLTVSSSKTIKYKERDLVIPLVKLSSPAFDIVSMLANHVRVFSSSPLRSIISPPNSYMHRKCEVPGSKCRFTSRN